jgi:hypothetical protein
MVPIITYEKEHPYGPPYTAAGHVAAEIVPLSTGHASLLRSLTKRMTVRIRKPTTTSKYQPIIDQLSYQLLQSGDYSAPG